MCYTSRDRVPCERLTVVEFLRRVTTFPMKSLEMLKSKEGQLNAVYACYGSVELPRFDGHLSGDRAQTVTVTALNDDDTANDAVTLTHTATSTDGNYSGITIAGVAVTVTDDTTTPTATLVLSAASIGEDGGVSTVTATVSPAAAAAFTVAAAAVSPAVAADFRLSANQVLSFAENATTSAGTVTITGVDNDVDAADKTVTVSGTVSATSVTAPANRTLTLEDDDDATNAPPSFISLAEFEVEENETAVGTVRAEDSDAGDAVTGLRDHRRR